MNFAETLKTLPAITHLAALQLLDAQGQVLATIENKPGQAGSLAVYAALAQRHGAITPAAAAEGLVLYAEHTADAQAHPASTPTSTACWRGPKARPATRCSSSRPESPQAQRIKDARRGTWRDWRGGRQAALPHRPGHA